ncbi:hypothetical protein NT04LS_0497 [Listeria seeligeri FSL S4-171]|nr:hypothetical protein NT04LS_0497 [Listeria seeligeri FSL S4-171]
MKKITKVSKSTKSLLESGGGVILKIQGVEKANYTYKRNKYWGSI